ncbi:MAG: c-type cytochrome [Gemmatimonadota bacterium]
MRTRRLVCGLALSALALALPAAAAAQWYDLAVPDRPTGSRESAEAGRTIYETHCWTCHGEQGDGEGPVASHLLPRPRDFTIASYKLRTTGSGELPTDEDLFRSITLGLPGTAMSSWGSTLSEDERWQVIAYLKTFADGMFEDVAFDPYAYIVEMGDPPDAPMADLVAAGREVFERSDCWECHGAVGRGDGQKGPDLTDDRGYPDRAADLENGGAFRGGSSPHEVYLRLSTGLDGSPMPSYVESLSDEERWQVAYFVTSLARDADRESKSSVVIRARRARGELPRAADDVGWAAATEVWIPLAGQGTFAPRWQTPSVSGLSVRALYGEREVAVRLTWNDRTADSVPADPARALAEGWTAQESWPRLFPDGRRARGSFPDAVEVLFPARRTKRLALPHFVYGDARNPVDVWQWSADRGGTAGGGPTGVGSAGGIHAARVLRAAGADDPPVAQANEVGRVTAGARFADGQWTVVFRRPLGEPTSPGATWRPGDLVPIAFHVRDGAHGETGLRMALSSWYFLQLEEPVRASSIAVVLLAVLACGLVEVIAIRYVRLRARRGELAIYLSGYSIRIPREN